MSRPELCVGAVVVSDGRLLLVRRGRPPGAGEWSVPGGRVELVWTVGEGEDRLLRMAWRESGGPPVRAPERTGMGSQLLKRQRGLDAVELRWHPRGVECTICVAGVRTG